MWFWLILTALANKSLVASMAESISNEFQEDVPEDSMYLYMDERALKEQKSDNDDIEARRRSALDKNFMRFGRGGNDLYLAQNHPYDLEDVDYADEFNRPSRTNNKNDNFIRFGRGKAGDFIRFGRDPYKYLARDSRGKDKNFIRFGRSVALKRSRRSAEGFESASKRYTNNMLRFGRNGNNGNFMRFGRIVEDYANDKDNQTERAYQHPYYPMSILPLLKQLAARLNQENKCIECSRLG